MEEMERVMAASTLPALLLGGEVSADAADQDARSPAGARPWRCPA